MFGYVRVDKPNILIKDFATYKAYYCGLCKSISAKYCNQLMRLGVNYDIAFLSMLAHNYEDVEPSFKDTRCFVHPIGPKFPVVVNDRVQERIVDINTVLGYYKVCDDRRDKGGLRYSAVKSALKPAYKKAAAALPELDAALKKCFSELEALEQAGSDDLDALAQTSADMLVAVGRAATDAFDEDFRVLAENLGRWIYVVDAYDDMAKDLKQNSFNPFTVKGSLSGEEEAELAAAVKERLYGYIREIRAAYDRMRIVYSEGPLSNVIYLGLRQKTDEVLQNGGKKCRKTLL